MITIGIDPHKSSLAAVALQPTGDVGATIRLEVNRDTVAGLRLGPRGGRSVSGGRRCCGLGRGVAQGLAAADEPVVDVPAWSAARARLLNTRHARKTDALDAAAVRRVAQHDRRLHPVRAEDDSLVLRLLSERRDDLAAERTRTANRLPALLRDLIPGGAKRNTTTRGLRSTTPNAIWDEAEQRLVSDAEVAETTFTAFTSRRRAEHITARLIVRRVRRLNPTTVPAGQTEAFAVYRYHAVFTDSGESMLAAEATHRDHAIIEQAIADLNDSALAHLPSVCSPRTPPSEG